MHVAGLAFVALFVAPRSSAAAIRDAGARGAGSVGQRRRKKQELAAITRVGIGPASTDQVLCTSVLSAWAYRLAAATGLGYIIAQEKQVMFAIIRLPLITRERVMCYKTVVTVGLGRD
jgi:hypothetical protein